MRRVQPRSGVGVFRRCRGSCCRKFDFLGIKNSKRIVYIIEVTSASNMLPLSKKVPEFLSD
jgi:hypothetical protein